jgi:NADPH:quinone reductase-like Zn-dependent oxidoreductase
MRAVVLFRCGPAEVVKICEAEKPAAKDNEGTIRVRASAANALDQRMMEAELFAAVDTVCGCPYDAASPE